MREHYLNDNYKKQGLLYRLIQMVVLYLFVLFAVFMPADNLNLKKLFFALFILISIPNIYKYIKVYRYKMLTFMTIIYPIFFIIVSILVFRNSFSDAFQIGHCGLYFLVFFAAQDKRLNYPYILINVMKIETIIIVASGILHYLSILLVSNNVFLKYLYTTENAMIGSGLITTSFGLMVFLKTSPILLILLGYSIQNNDIKWIILSALALFFSGTRANVFCMLILVFFYLFGQESRSYKITMIRRIILLGILFIILFTLFPSIISFLSDVFTRRENNDITRNSLIEDILNLFKNNPATLFVGTGFGSFIFSTDRNAYINILEISYLDLLRQVGIIGMIPFMIFILQPIKFLYKTNKWIAFSYITYLAVAATNPLLYSSTAYLVYVYIYFYMNTGELQVKWNYKIKWNI